RPRLHRRIHHRRKLGPHGVRTMRTILDLRSMFSHLQRLWRQIENLATLVVQHRLPLQTSSPAFRTHGQFMNLNVIRLFDSLEGLTAMSGLAPGFAAAAGAQTLGTRSEEHTSELQSRF